MTNKVYINLPVKDLKRSVAFFTHMGFRFNPRFTDENGTCMIVSDTIYVMLLIEKFFKTFINQKVADASRTSEVIISLEVEKKEEIEELLNKAIQAGGKATISEDYDWMKDRGFTDIDGHHWELLYTDESKSPA